MGLIQGGKSQEKWLQMLVATTPLLTAKKIQHNSQLKKGGLIKAVKIILKSNLNTV